MFKILKKLLETLFAIVLVLATIITLYVKLHPVFGGKPDKKDLERFKKSKNYTGKKFKNIYPLNMEKEDRCHGRWL